MALGIECKEVKNEGRFKMCRTRVETAQLDEKTKRNIEKSDRNLKKLIEYAKERDAIRRSKQ
jgi:hypothetical protein